MTGFGLISPCDGADVGCVTRFGIAPLPVLVLFPLLPPKDGAGDTDGRIIFPKKADARFDAFCVAELKSFERPGVSDETLDPLTRPGLEGETLDGEGDADT